MRLSTIFSALLGMVLAGFGFLIVLGSIFNIAKPDNQQPVFGYFVLIVLLGLFPIGLAAGLFYFAWRNHKNQKLETVEREILNLATQCGGKLTVAEVSMKTKMNSFQAKENLDLCHANGLADIHVSQNGEVEYLFFGRS